MAEKATNTDLISNTFGKGRKKGSLNRITIETRQFLLNLFEENEDKIKQDLATLSPIQRLNILIKLLPYIVPRINTIKLDLDTDDGTNNAMELITKVLYDSKKK